MGDDRILVRVAIKNLVSKKFNSNYFSILHIYLTSVTEVGR